MVVAVVAVVLSVTGSAVAAKLITGRQIKDGSISAKDLSKAVRAQLAKTGVPGPQGASGLPGPAGPAGSNATLTGVAAGGALAGVYPNPSLAAGSVGAEQVADGSLTPADSGPVPVLSLFGGSGPVPVATATTVAMPWDDDVLAGVVDIDTDDMHSYTQNPSDVRAPRSGVYALAATVGWDADAAGGAGTRDLRFHVVQQGFSSSLSTVAASTDAVRQSGAVVLRLAEGDIVRISVRQTSGAALSARARQLSLHWIGPSP